MLKADLMEGDIPGRTTIRKRVEEVFQEHLDQLKKEMKVRAVFVEIFGT